MENNENISYKVCKLRCDTCNWKRTGESVEMFKDLYEIKTSPVPGGIPYLDPVTKKIVKPKSVKQKRKFRCPNCGHGMTPVMVPDFQKASEAKTEIEKRVEDRKKLEEKIFKERNARTKDELSGSPEGSESESDRIDGSEGSPKGRTVSE